MNLSLPQRIIQSISRTYDKSQVEAEVLDTVSKSIVPESNILSNIQIRDGALYAQEKFIDANEFNIVLSKLGDKVLNGPDSTRQIHNLIRIAVSSDLEQYSGTAKSHLNSILNKPSIKNKDTVFAILIEGFQNNSNEHQIATANKLVQAFSNSSDSLSTLMQDFHSKMKQYGDIGDAFRGYGESLISSVLDRRESVSQARFDTSLENILEANPSLLKQTEQSSRSLLQKCFAENSNHIPGNNFIKKFEDIVVDVICNPGSDAKHKQAITDFKDTVAGHVKEQTKLNLQIQLLEKELKQLTVEDTKYKSYQTELNQARETYTQQDKKFKEATLHIALAFEKISVLSTEGSKSPGLADIFIKSILGKQASTNEDTRKHSANNFNDDLIKLFTLDNFRNETSSISSGINSQVQNIQDYHETTRNSQDLYDKAKSLPTVNGTTPVNPAYIPFDDDTVTNLIKILNTPGYRDNEKATKLLSLLNDAVAQKSTAIATDNLNHDIQLIDVKLSLYDFLLDERQKGIQSLLPDIQTKSGLYKLDEQEISAIEQIRDIYKARSISFEAPLLDDEIKNTYSKILSDTATSILGNLTPQESAESVSSLTQHCNNLIPSNNSSALTDSDVKFEPFINFINKFLHCLNEVLGLSHNKQEVYA
jgi:hypothetical protein